MKSRRSVCYFFKGRRNKAVKKSYQKVSDYIKKRILSGELKPKDKIPPERELAEDLDISRGSVREGLRTLENMGVIKSVQGSGNFITDNFEETVTEIMSFMYVLKGMDVHQITEFRYTIEWEAMELAVKQATDQQKMAMQAHLKMLKAIDDEDMCVPHDKAIHYLLVEASGNSYMMTTYNALTRIMDLYIPRQRANIIAGMKENHTLQAAHDLMVEGVVEGDLKKGMEGIKRHFQYIRQYQDEV